VSTVLSVGVVTFYLLLLAIAISTGERELLQLPERFAAGLSAVVLLTASVIRVLVMLVRPAPKTRVGSVILVVHMVSFSAHALLAACPCPMLIDDFTGCRVHLVRWCEWTVHPFTMPSSPRLSCPI
jgi:hypothetical protein